MLMVLALLLAGPATAWPMTLAGADEEFRRIDYPATEAICDSLLRQEPRNPEVLWRLARVNISMAEVAEKSHKEDFYRCAESYARRCIEADSTLAAGHTWLAAALGNLAMFEGSRAKVRLCHDIKHELDLALALNPQDDIAWSILGSFYRALGNVSWFERQIAAIFIGSLPPGGYEDAEAALRHAIALAPHVLRHRHELALLYVDWGRDEEAKAALDTAATMPVIIASDHRRLELVRELRASLER